MKRILVIFTGGTIASTLNNGIIDTDSSKPYELIEKYKTVDDSVLFETCEPYFILSENLSGEHISKLFACVKDALTKGYDGIIVTHGTDTLQYSASALDIALGKIQIPVLLVSSNYPLDEAQANGFYNFSGAVKFINQDRGKGVFVCYKNKNETTKFHSPENLLDYDCYSDTLRSIDNNIYGEFRKCGRFYHNKEFCFNENYLKINDLSLSERSPVLRLKVYPGMNYPSVDGYKCVIVDTYHSGTLKTDDMEFEKFVENVEIPIVLTGVSDGNIYKSVENISLHKNIVMSTYSPIYTYMKCWILIENGLNINENF